MKNYHSFIFILSMLGLFLASISLSSCKKTTNEAPTLPPATNNGSNTMGAYINNVVWVPAPSFYYTGIQADYSGTAFRIIGYTNNSNRTEKTSVHINLRNFSGTGNYSLNNPLLPIGLSNSGQVLIEQNTAPVGQIPTSIEYDTDSLHLGQVTITKFDPVKQIVSGTFQFDAINQNKPIGVTHVTAGRFDVACPLYQLY